MSEPSGSEITSAALNMQALTQGDEVANSIILLLGAFQATHDNSFLDTAVEMSQAVESGSMASHILDTLIALRDRSSSAEVSLTLRCRSLVEEYDLAKGERELTQAITQIQIMAPETSEGALVIKHSLSRLLHERYKRFGSLDDLEASIRYSTEMMEIPGISEGNRLIALGNLACRICEQFERLGDINDLHLCISQASETVQNTPHGDENMASRLHNLANFISIRFNNLGDINDLHRAIAHTSEALKAIPREHCDRASILNNLSGYILERHERLGDINDLHLAITYSLEAAQATPQGHADKPTRLSNLGGLIHSRFERLGDVNDLHLAITYSLEAVQATPQGHTDKPIEDLESREDLSFANYRGNSPIFIQKYCRTKEI